MALLSDFFYIKEKKRIKFKIRLEKNVFKHKKDGVRMIERPRYIEKLVSYKDNGKVKIITGIKRCGKSYLLN